MILRKITNESQRKTYEIALNYHNLKNKQWPFFPFAFRHKLLKYLFINRLNFLTFGLNSPTIKNTNKPQLRTLFAFRIG